MSQTDARSDLRTLGALYEDTRQRVVNLVREATFVDHDAASRPTPACGGWRVRDVIAHLCGLVADIESGNLDGAATDAWTAAQVDARRGLSIEELLAESDEVGPRLAALLDDFPGRYGAQVVADVTVHEHDIRGGLAEPGARDSTAVRHSLEFLLTTIVGPGARALGVAPLHIVAGDTSIVVGGTDGAIEDASAAIQAAIASLTWPPDPDPTDVARTRSLPRLEADAFELFRAVTGRRSLDQVHRLGWSVEPAPYDALFGLWPFTPQSADLVE